MDAVTDDQNGHPTYLALEPRDRSLVRAILMAALRHRGELERVIAGYVDRPLPQGAHSLRAILHVAAAQIFFLDIPSHSAVDLAVECANRDPRNRKFAALINAVTRRMVRERDDTLVTMKEMPAKAPDWFHERLVDVYGAEHAADIGRMHRHPAPLDLTMKMSDDTIAEALLDREGAKRMDPSSIRLSISADVTSLPGFAEGTWWVQDYAASLPAKMFGDIAGQRILDLCAAPGGKTAQLLAAGARVTALEKSANRAKRLRENLERTKLAEGCDVTVTDLFTFEPDVLFDGVLLDAPCSSTGTVRRHPDIPWTKTPDDIAKLADLQAKMLVAASAMVAQGGQLVFSNCSLDPREGEEVMRAFLAENGEAFATEPIDGKAQGLLGLNDDMLTDEGWVRTTPAHRPHENPALAGMDGFFAARLRKR